MSFSLNNIFTTVTANPFHQGNYTEIEPCRLLKPYIRCFWGFTGKNPTVDTAMQNTYLVIPDLCMDIIITENNHNIYGGFCGIQNRYFTSTNSEEKIFGVRMYAWSVTLFADDSMKGILNTFTDVNTYFSDFTDNLKFAIMNCGSIYERKEIAEKYLLNKLKKHRENYDVMNSLYRIIVLNGKTTVSDLSDYCAVSKRQLERKFTDNIGVTPKQMINLIRYQLLWQDSIKSGFDVLDSVEKFGFCDQSHLLKEFKKYHGTSLGNAKNVALNMSHFYNTN